MARRHRSSADLYAYYLRRKAQVTLRGLRPTALRGRWRGPRVLVNSIPKSGTHLVERALEAFPLLRHAGRRTLIDWSGPAPGTLRTLRGIRRGQFLLAHLPAFAGLSPLLQREGVRTLFVIRDPRDVLVSLCRYLTEIHQAHRSHPHFAALPDDAARLDAAIRGVEGVVAPMDEVLRRYAGWLDAPGVLVVRFEELIGPRGGGSAAGQSRSLERIAEFLGIELSVEALRCIAADVFSPASPTFRDPGIGRWREAFAPRQLRDLDDRAGEMLARYGYPREAPP